jgi:DNA repair photolyase
VDLREHLFALVGARPGDVIGGAILRDASSEVAPRLTFEIGGRALHVEILLAEPPRAQVSAPRPSAARSGRLLFSYRAADGMPRPADDIGLALCRAVAAAAAPREERVLAALAGEVEASARGASSRVREVRVDRLLEPVGDRFFTLSPYVGCLVGCRFCYAQRPLAEVRRLAQLPDVAWGSYVDVRMNAAEILARELDALPPLPVKLCPIVSDPYHAVEARYAITRACLEVLRDHPRRPTFVLTRLALVTRDIDVLAAMPGAYAGVSLPTLDDEAGLHFEPRASLPSERLAALRALRAAGVRTFAVVQPILPGSIAALADSLAEAAGSVSIGLLEGVEGAAADFADPRYAEAADPAWQRDRAAELAEALGARGVPIWPGSPGELPAELCS